VVGFVLLAWLALAGVQLFRAVRTADSALDSLEAVREEFALEDLLDDQTDRSMLKKLDDAERKFDDASEQTSGLATAPLRYLPVVGRHVDCFDDLSSTASKMSGSISRAADGALDVTAGFSGTSQERLATIDALTVILHEARVDLRDTRPCRTNALLSGLRDARDRLQRERTRVHDQVGNAEATLVAARQLLAGPSRYLLLAANNAEMRNGSGMFLSVGELRAEAGAVSIDEMQSTGLLKLDRPVAVDPSIEGLWGFADSGAEWRSLGVSPRFPVVAEQASRMWEAVGGERVDGVIAVDVTALRALLAVVGPVTLSDGTVVDSENV
jgi:Protein of unknown function (DUF4012)